MRNLFVVLVALALAACTTTNPQTMTGATPPAAARILVVEPDVQLSILTASGLQEPRADWSEAARTGLAEAFATNLRTQGHTPGAFSAVNNMEGRVGQIIRLHEAVAFSIFLNNYAPGGKLPTKAEGFDWTLGEGASAIAAASGTDADYALFTVVRGSYSSGGRMAMAIVGAALGAAVPLGGQQMYTSLVDLRTGQVIWFNFASAGSGVDMRDPAGAATLVDQLLKSAPL